MAGESREWLGVFFETQARLRHDPEFERRMEPPEEEQRKLLDWFRTRQEDGTFRSDLSPRDLARFATIVLNGLALRVRRRRRDGRESVVRLLNDALSPPH